MDSWVYWDGHNALNFFPQSGPAVSLLSLLKPFPSLTLLPSLNSALPRGSARPLLAALQLRPVAVAVVSVAAAEEAVPVASLPAVASADVMPCSWGVSSWNCHYGCLLCHFYIGPASCPVPTLQLAMPTASALPQLHLGHSSVLCRFLWLHLCWSPGILGCRGSLVFCSTCHHSPCLLSAVAVKAVAPPSFCFSASACPDALLFLSPPPCHPCCHCHCVASAGTESFSRLLAERVPLKILP